MMREEELKDMNEEVACDIACLDVGKKEESEKVGEIDEYAEEMTDEEKRQFEANKLASMCYCEKLVNKEEEDEEEKEEDEHDDKADRVKFADTVVVCPTYTSQVG